MAHASWETSSDLERRWLKRKAPSMGIPGWAGLVIVALGLTLAGMGVWEGGKYVLNRLRPSSVSASTTSGNILGSSLGHLRARVPEWQGEAQTAFRDGIADATSGNIDGAEIDVDRGAEILSEARSHQLIASPDFFELTIRTLDQVVQAHPDSDRLIEHTALARLELAQMRTMLPAGTGTVSDASRGSSGSGAEEKPAVIPSSGDLAVTQKTVEVSAPVSIGANSTYDAARAHGTLLDATMMAGDAEILLPPASRLVSDGVRVRNLTLKAASQTLDGVYWENVTFIGTRLRYDGGEVSLHNVRFINCTFGMPSNERGARLASAIALGESSIVIE